MITTIKEWKAFMIKESISDEQTDKIISLYRLGKGQAEIADMLNIDIYYVINATNHLGISTITDNDFDDRHGDDPSSKQYYDRTLTNEALSEKSIEKKVAEINDLISKANEKELDVIDKSGTWQEPMNYKPIVYKNGKLYIEYTEPYSPGKANKETITKANMELDGIPTLNNISKMYKAALKKASINENNKTFNWSSKGMYKGYTYVVGNHPETNKNAFGVWNKNKDEYDLYDNSKSMENAIDLINKNNNK